MSITNELYFCIFLHNIGAYEQFWISARSLNYLQFKKLLQYLNMGPIMFCMLYSPSVSVENITERTTNDR